MCGINGVFHYAGGVADPRLLERQATAMTHRGPDGSGLWHEGPAGLAQRRLAIIDLSEGGRQPMANEDETIVVTYNGELYGWPEMRAELARRGHRFRGSSDTEALLHLYEDHGTDLFRHLRGMFTFGLYDRPRRRLLLGRDRMGIKPLYYHDDGRRVAFASELKALMLDPTIPRDVDDEALALYLTYQYVPGQRTIWRGVRKLPPGHFLTCDENGPRLERYWELPSTPGPSRSIDEHRAELRALLAEAVRLRMVADVPLGAFLSGGVDSSAVVALMAQASTSPIKTFSIGFDDLEASELEHARRVARHLGTDHHEEVVRPRAMEDLPRLVWQLDEPFADASMLPTYYVSRMARRHVTVALSGDGGDELYAGYTTYGWALQYAAADRVPGALRRLAAFPGAWLPGDHPLGRKLHRLGMSVVDRHLDVMAYFPPRALADLLSPALRRRLAAFDPWQESRARHAAYARTLGDVPALLALDALTYMVDDVLVKVDRTSMLCSLEVRVPLIDHRVVEAVAALPFDLKLRDGVTKWILKESVKDLLPPETLARGKQGFAVPLERWLGRGFERLARETLLDPRSLGRGWLDPQAVERLVSDRSLRAERRSRRLWALLCLELWAQAYLDRPRERLSEPAALALSVPVPEAEVATATVGAPASA
jgi:asparagine synthase (glutamine-hydrolysing)